MLLFALGFGCQPAPVPLSALSEHRLHPTAKLFHFSATPEISKYGVSVKTARRRWGSGPSDFARHKTWVVPLYDLGDSSDGVVQAWVSPPGFRDDAAFASWSAQLADTLSAGPVAWKVRYRTGERPTGGASLAVADATQRWGITSEPGSPIFSFTPE